MDSFYEEPRRPPVPASINQIPTCQLMPEVSILIANENRNINTGQNRTNINKRNSYNVWKAQNHLQATKNKENVPIYNECQRNISKISSAKQVRFNSPNIHNESRDISSNNIDVNKCLEPGKLKPNVLNRPFEEIYMANIPNRHLDLSLIEPVTNKYSKLSANPAKETSNVTEMIACRSINKNDTENYDSLINGTSYRRQTIPKKVQKDLEYQPQKYANVDRRNMTQMPQNRNPCFSYDQFKPTIPSQSNIYSCKSIEDKKENDNSTVRDLLKVVQQQNEQILVLQKQVALLLENQSNQKKIKAPPIQQEPNYSQEYFPNSRNMQQNQKGTVSKFAIDVMTSLEVSIRQQPNCLPRNKCKDLNDELKIQEITEFADAKEIERQDIACDNILGDIKAEAVKNGGKNQNTQVSFALNEPLQIMERCPSPAHSIHVDMQDYSSESDDDSAESTDIGWTIYNNVMGQVNNILKNANTDIQNFGTDTNINANRICDRTLRKVKEATMRHLKNIGVNLPVIDEPDSSHRSDETVNGSEFTPTEISFAVKQLLMKYLPDEQLAKITAKNPIVQKQKSNPNKENLIKRRPEFSFATLQYMKKYNLLTTDSVQMEPPVKQNKNIEVPKILDVTALKQQPKLL